MTNTTKDQDKEEAVTEEVITAPSSVEEENEIIESLSEGNDAPLYGSDNLLSDSNFVSVKPDTFSGNLLGSSVPQNNILDLSPLNQSGLGFEKLGQLRGLGSLFFAEISSDSLSGSSFLLFDSLIGRFASGTSLQFNSDLPAFQRDKVILPTISKPPSDNSGPSNANDIIFGTSGDDLLRGNVLGAPDPLSPLLALVDPNQTVNGAFGSDVAVSGNVAVVGAFGEDTGATDAGSVYIYDVTTGALLRTLNNPTPTASDRFGEKVAIDGNIAVIGASRDNATTVDDGAAFIFDVTTGALLHTLTGPTPAASDGFGASVAIDGNYVLVGEGQDTVGGFRAGSLHVYDATTGALINTFNNPTPASGDLFGNAVAIDGDIAVIGAVSDDTGASNSGSAYIYNVATGTLLHTINNPNPLGSAAFGGEVSVDGNLVAIAATGSGLADGAAYIFDATTGGLLQTITKPSLATNSFGVGIEISGDYLIVGDITDDSTVTNEGALHIFDVTTGDLLHTINNPNPNAGDQFGRNLAVDGNTIITGSVNDDDGAFNTGTAHIFHINFDDADSLFGGAGDDMLFGLKGNDTLYGQAGADSLTGGAGADRFVFEDATVFDAVDTIEDFSQAEGDVIDVSDILVGYTFGVSDINDFVRFVDSGADTVLEIDANGTVGGVSFQGAANIIGGAGLDETTLETLVQLDGVI